ILLFRGLSPALSSLTPNPFSRGPRLRAGVGKLDRLQDEAFGWGGDAQIFTQSAVQSASECIGRQVTPPDVDQCSRDDAQHVVEKLVAGDRELGDARIICRRRERDAKKVSHRLLTRV